MAYIITPQELRELGRPIGKVDDKQLLAYITEAEQMLVKPMLGAELLTKLKQYADGQFPEEPDERINTLLYGGSYEDTNEVTQSFTGLRIAVSYYVYAQNIMVGDFQSTRFGMVVKNDDYSERLSSRERSDAYNNALEVAQNYMQDCVDYCKSSGLITAQGRGKWSGSVRIRKIG